MKYSLFRIEEYLEIISLLIFCFSINIFIHYMAQFLSSNESLLADIVQAIYKYKIEINLALSVLIILLIYKIIKIKKKEFRLRNLLGATIYNLIISYFIGVFCALVISWGAATIVALYLNISPMVNNGLLLIYFIYLLISLLWVNKYEQN